MSLLSIHNVGKSYGNVKALTDFSAELDCGVYALLGPNGSGKSTLMNILTDNLAMDSGKILYNGKSIYSLGKEYRAALGFMPQYPGMYPTFSVNDCLKYMAVLKGVPRREAKAQIAGLLERVGLPASAAERLPHEFSGGQRQRIAIARALAVNPRLIICDEPTSALDVSVQAQILNLMKAIQKETGMAYLFITHNFAVVEYLADRVAVMEKGRLVEAGDAAEVLCNPQAAYTKRLLKAVPRLDL